MFLFSFAQGLCYHFRPGSNCQTGQKEMEQPQRQIQGDLPVSLLCIHSERSFLFLEKILRDAVALEIVYFGTGNTFKQSVSQCSNYSLFSGV